MLNAKIFDFLAGFLPRGVKIQYIMLDSISYCCIIASFISNGSYFSAI